MNIRTLFTLMASSVLAILVALGFILSLLMSNQQQLTASDEARYHSYQLADTLRQSSDDLTRLARTYAVSGGEQKWLDQYDAIINIRNGVQPRPEDYHLIYWDLLSGRNQTPPRQNGEAIALVEVMKQAGFTEQELQKLEEVAQYSTELAKMEDKAIKLVHDKPTPESIAAAVQQLHSPAYHEKKVAVMRPFLDFFRLMEQRAKHDVDAATERAEWLIGCLFALVVLMVIIMAAGITMAARRMRSSVQRFSESTEAVAAGDLTHALDAQAAREMGSIATVFNSMLGTLRESMREITQANRTMAEVADDVHSKSVHTNEAVDQQRKQTLQVATAVNEISASLQDVARSTEQASTAAITTREAVGHGQDTVRNSIDHIHQLSSEVDQTAEAVQVLSEDCNAIGDVLDVISSIAEQTNLLALNAAIEAARAGDAGRGFAVVAEEVRNLAQRTSNSTTQIQEMIERLQQGSHQAVTRLDRSRRYAHECVENGEITTQAFDEITAHADAILEMNTQIAAAVEQQSTVVEEVNQSITRISSLAENVNQDMNHTVDACDSLNQLASQVNSRVSHFRT